jgi:hypothetical protein
VRCNSARSEKYTCELRDSLSRPRDRRVRYGVGPDLICQPGPSPGIKTHSSPTAFPTTLSLSFVPFPSSTFLHFLLVPQAAPSSTYSPARPPIPHRTDTTRPVGKMSQRSTPRQHCLVDRLTRRPLTVTPMKRPAFQQIAGDLAMRRALDARLPPFKASSTNPSHLLSPPWSTKAASARRLAASPLRHHYVVLSPISTATGFGM